MRFNDKKWNIKGKIQRRQGGRGDKQKRNMRGRGKKEGK
jgi:hypothetical protein